MSANAINRQRWAAAGLCNNCGSRPKAFLSLKCQRCLVVITAASKRRSGARAAARILRDYWMAYPHARKKA